MIVNRKGLHARASARLSKLAGQFDAHVTVYHEAECADARSIMDLLVTAIASLIAEGFGERGPDDEIC